MDILNKQYSEPQCMRKGISKIASLHRFAQDKMVVLFFLFTLSDGSFFSH